ncbi:DUF3102 domain-containing protein [Thermodesulfobacteriota bacterium]
MRETPNSLISKGTRSGSGLIQLALCDADRDSNHERVKEIITLHQEVEQTLLSCIRLSLPKALRIGELLIKQKDSLKHGEFIPWIKTNLPFTDRSARNYMRLFKERERLKTENVSDLSLAYRLINRLTSSENKYEENDTVERSFLTLSLDTDQKELIFMALDEAMAMLKTDSKSRALEHIALDWLEYFTGLSEPVPIETMKRKFEKTYNVKITIKNREA